MMAFFAIAVCGGKLDPKSLTLAAIALAAFVADFTENQMLSASMLAMDPDPSLRLAVNFKFWAIGHYGVAVGLVLRRLQKTPWPIYLPMIGGGAVIFVVTASPSTIGSGMLVGVFGVWLPVFGMAAYRLFWRAA